MAIDRVGRNVAIPPVGYGVEPALRLASQSCKTRCVLEQALLEQSQPLAHDVAGVLETTRGNGLLDGIVQVARKANATGRHGSLHYLKLA